MKIAVVGPGAMGCLFAWSLARGGRHEVWLVDHDPRRAALLRRRGLTLVGPTGIRRGTVRVAAACPGSRAGICDAVIVLVKSPDTASAARNIRACVGPRTLVATFQNGLGNAEAIRRVLGGRLAGNVAGGVTAQGATLLSPGRVRHAGRGETIMESPRNHRAGAARFCRVLSGAGLPARTARDIRRRAWGKLVVNSAINPLGALFGVPNGELARRPAYRTILGLVLDESARVAGAEGVRMSRGAARRWAVAVCRATAGNRNSMLQDLERGRRTEIASINGAIVIRARDKGMAAPLNEMLSMLVRGRGGV